MAPLVEGNRILNVSPNKSSVTCKDTCEWVVGLEDLSTGFNGITETWPGSRGEKGTIGREISYKAGKIFALLKEEEEDKGCVLNNSV